MQFIITAYDGTDAEAPARRQAVRAGHLENIKRVRETGSVVCAGGITNDEGRAIGSFLVMEFASKALFDAYLKSEPYVLGNVWQTIRVETCNVVIMNDVMVGK